VLYDTFAEVGPTLVGFGVAGLVGLDIEDIGTTKVGSKYSGDLGPAHEFVDSKEVEQFGIGRDLGVAWVFVDAVEEVGLLIVIRGEDYVVDYSLKSL
jgi:hypothetical protein